ncbi:Fur family transcriptional regulator [Streptomyces similanensis]|uniref:Zinc uptake transcriptional repressor Zur n=1 Tax=Streptomyces similanensis TaxID=1274988 RepID=A0ABP9KVP4_9ACTN
MTTNPSSAQDDATTPPDAPALLRAHGLRRTTSRVCTLTMLSASRRHLSSAEACAELHRRGTPFDPATVYRTLESLTAVGLTHVVHAPGPKRYGVSSEPHHHTVCEQCGQVSDVAGDHVKAAVEQVARLTGLSPDSSGSLLVYGRCTACAQGSGEPVRGGAEGG